MKHMLCHINLTTAYAMPKLSRLSFLIACTVALCCVSCRRDLVELTDSSTSVFSIVLPEDGGTLIRGLEGGDTLKAQIQLPGKAVSDFDTAAYSFLWTSFRNKDTLSRKYYVTTEDFDSQDPTLISCLLTVTDKKTGIAQNAVTNVLITSITREGWVLLGDKSGNAKLSMLTYTPEGYRKFIDLETELGIQLPINGKPNSIEVVGTEIGFGSGKYQWLVITTDQEVKFVKSMDMKADLAISNYLTQILQPSAASPVSMEVNGQTSFVATKDGNITYFSNFSMKYLGILSYSKLSTYPPRSASGTAFHASANHTFTAPGNLAEYSRLMFDEDNSVFVRAHLSGSTDVNGVYTLPLPFNLNGFQLKAITTQKGATNDDIIALLNNPTTQESYLIQFLSNRIVKTVTSIPYADMQDILASKFLEIDYNAGYLIYVKGSEVNAYDYKVGQRFKLLDFGNETISLVKMIKHFPPASTVPGRVDLYKQLLKKLVVCTFDPANPNNSGVFRLFQVPLGHQTPVKETEETGFPKIVDITFAPIQ